MRIRLLALASLLVGNAILSPGALAEPSAFRPATEATAPEAPAGVKHAWAIGLAFATTVPFSSPYQLEPAGGGTSSAFRFQIPASIMLGFEYSYTRDLDLGLWAGIENYSSRAPIALAGGASGGEDLQVANFRAFPVEAIARWRLNGGQRISAEFEGGLGYAFGKLEVTSTEVNAAVNSNTLNFIRAHAGAGAAFGWDENTTLHTSVGYGLSLLGSNTYSASATTQVRQGNLSGLYVKALVRHRF